MLEVGACLVPSTDLDIKIKVIRSLVDNSHEKYISGLVMELMEFEEKRNKKDLVYWTKYVARFGS
jgi:hypothetical protein